MYVKNVFNCAVKTIIFTTFGGDLEMMQNHEIVVQILCQVGEGFGVQIKFQADHTCHTGWLRLWGSAAGRTDAEYLSMDESKLWVELKSFAMMWFIL